MEFGPLKGPPKIGGPGSTVSLNTTFTQVAVPTLPDGTYPRYVLLSWKDPNYVNVRYYELTEFPITEGIALNPYIQPFIFDVSGCSHFYAYRYHATTDPELHITPLGNA